MAAVALGTDQAQDHLLEVIGEAPAPDPAATGDAASGDHDLAPLAAVAELPGIATAPERATAGASQIVAPVEAADALPRGHSHGAALAFVPQVMLEEAAAPAAAKAPTAVAGNDARDREGTHPLQPANVSLSAPQAEASAPPAAEAAAVRQAESPLPQIGATSVAADAVAARTAELLADGGATIAAQADTSLIHLDQFRSDLRFSGIDGSGVTVVVIDTGIDVNHGFFGPDANANGVADRIVFQYDFSGGNDANASDFNGHGSNVTSIVASQDATYTGMAPGCNIIALKVFPDGNGSASTLDIQEALSWVVANRAAYNIVAVNMSLGYGDNLNAPTNSPFVNNIATLAANNCAVVVASGNAFYQYQAQGVATPSADPNAWSVGAVWDRYAGGPYNWGSGAIDYSTGPDQITSFSQRSATMSTIFAPGGQITGAYWNGGLSTYSGTSQAAPHIAGLVADLQELALQVSGRLMSVSDLRATMVSSSVTIYDGDDENDNVANTGQTYHRVDAYAWGVAVLDRLFAGTAGVDTLNGTAAADVIRGQRGNDTLRGSGGADWLYGGDGSDTLTGGAGADHFAWSNVGTNVAPLGNDTITDLTAEDRIELSALVTGLSSPIDPVGAGYVRFLQSGNDVLIQVDADGTNSASGFITLVTAANQSVALVQANTTLIPNVAPQSVIANHSVNTNEWAQVVGWVGYSDANGDPAIQYQFWDDGLASNSGYFWTPSNPHQPAGQAITVAASDLGNVWVRGGTTPGSETMWVRAYDGSLWGAWDSFTLVTNPNTAPVATVADHSLHTNEWSRVDSWISYTDADGSAATSYQFWDGGAAGSSGYFWTPSNPHHAAGETITVAANELANVWVRGGKAAGSETLWVRAFDGSDWSTGDTFNLTTLPNNPPVATIADHSLHTNEWSRVDSWISYADADGNAATTYQFWDGGPAASSAYFWTPSNPQHAAGETITVAASDLANVWLRGGQAVGSETLWVRAFDGSDWSSWDTFNLTTVPNNPPVATIADHSLHTNEWSRVNSWISYADPDGNAATTYQFWDGGPGASSGYFWTPSNPQHPAGETITVAASDLANVWLRGGQAVGSETLWVRAFDGSDWSTWDTFNLTTVPGSMSAGTASDSILTGDSLDNLLEGTAGNDTIRFGDLIGNDRITGFNAVGQGVDRIDLSDRSTHLTFDQLMASASNDGHDTTISLDSHDSITIEGKLVAELQAAHFIV